MKKAALLVITFAFFATGCTAQAVDQGGKADMMTGTRSMDANSDGALSKDEFMSAHEAMFERMKNKEGVVKMDDMAATCAGMMSGGGMMDGGMMHGGGMMNDGGMMHRGMTGQEVPQENRR